jgi:endoglycosylceramidase
MRTTSAAVLAATLSFLAACSGSTAAGGHRSVSHTTSPPVTGQPASTVPAAIPAVANAATGPVGPLRSPGGAFLEDRFGRVVLLHGADLVYKVPPYEVVVNGSGPNVLTVPEVQNMAAQGFDVVRLGIIWKGLEPGTAPINDPAICAPGHPRASGPAQFDAAVFDAYVQRLDATIALLGSYGIYSLIDMHQDVYNEVFGGEGAPDWAVCTGGVKPRPELNVPNWSVNLQGPGVDTAYAHFWDNDVMGNLQGEFDSIWARVAADFRDNPWVIGYDPFNEPYGPGVPPQSSGAQFDAELQCFYTGRAHPGQSQSGRPVTCPVDDPAVGLIPRIEAADPNHLVFYEGNYATDSGPANHIGPMPFPRLVLNFHDYCFLHVPNGPEPPSYATVCTPSEDLVFTEHADQRVRDSTPEQPGGPASLLTEFGATTDAADLARVTSDADAHLTGWIYWQWLDYDDPTGSHDSGLWPPSPPTPAMLTVLSRTYAAAIAGRPTATSFDPVSGDFTLRFRPDSEITEPTVIFVPVATHYPDGYCATATGAHITSAPGASDVDVQNTADATEATVTITPGHC